MAGKVIIVQGGQWGSEAKGLVTHKLTLEAKPRIAIRTGTVNAGHTVYYGRKAYAMQQLPVSWVDPGVLLVLGPGAYIHPAIFRREVEWICDATSQRYDAVLRRILIDRRCGLHLPQHTERSKEANRHHSMGATGKGCSEAVIDKIRLRGDEDGILFADMVKEAANGSDPFWKAVHESFTDTVDFVNEMYDYGGTLLIEGTQGTLLDLHLGDYPYTTHKQTQAANWLAEAGLSCTVNQELWCVYRSYPIRVAGNSGPLPGEIPWTDLARKINRRLINPLVKEEALRAWESAVSKVCTLNWPDIDIPEPAFWSQEYREQHREAASEIHALAFAGLSDDTQAELRNLFELTTVTRKLRRIAEWDWPTFERSIALNRPHKIALTFLNYKWPEMWVADGSCVLDGLGQVSKEAIKFYKEVESHAAGATIGMVSFGPRTDNCFMFRRG